MKRVPVVAERMAQPNSKRGRASVGWACCAARWSGAQGTVPGCRASQVLVGPGPWTSLLGPHFAQGGPSRLSTPYPTSRSASDPISDQT